MDGTANQRDTARFTGMSRLALWRPGVLALLLAGACSGLALPPFGLWFVLAVTVPILILHLEGLGHRAYGRAFRAGLVFGFGYFVAAFHWIGVAFFVNPSDIWMMPFAVGGLALFMSLYWACAVTAALAVPEHFAPRWLAAILFLALAEWLRGRLLTGFPWAVPGLAADGMGSAEQLASLVGMNGLTLLVLLWAALPFVLWAHWKESGRLGVVTLVVVLLLPASAVWGSWRMGNHPVTYTGSSVVRLVQPNISQDDKWRANNAEGIFAKLIELSVNGAGEKGITHVIWPESSVPFLLDEDAVALARIGDLLRPGRTLIAGAIRRGASDGGAEPYYTSILVFDDRGDVTGTYDKSHLVPGGEYLPLENFLAPLGFRKVVSVPESFTPGSGPANLQLGGIGPAGALICYEVVFPQEVVGAQRPVILVNVTNDGWFGRSTGPYQHLAQARMRTIEQGLPMLRAANTGISAVIDPVGRVLAHSELDTSGVIDSRIPEVIAATVYSHAGDSMLLLLFFASLILLRNTRIKSAQLT